MQEYYSQAEYSVSFRAKDRVPIRHQAYGVYAKNVKDFIPLAALIWLPIEFCRKSSRQMVHSTLDVQR
jgi:hypothetical protein